MTGTIRDQAATMHRIARRLVLDAVAGLRRATARAGRIVMRGLETLRARPGDGRSEAEQRCRWSAQRTAILHRFLSGADMAAAPRPPQSEGICR